MKAKIKVKCSSGIIINVKMAHGHGTITEHPMHGESQACVNTGVPLLAHYRQDQSCCRYFNAKV